MSLIDPKCHLADNWHLQDRPNKESLTLLLMDTHQTQSL